MKLEIDLDQVSTGAEWGETVAEVIRQEVLQAVRNAVRAEVKSHNDRIKADVKSAMQGALKELSGAKIRELAAKLVKES